ncbi:MAG: glycosyltransferase family 2 protein [Bacteroidetes bacterium]|nr:glycosyltransferase family 2 protein [Bacteroidota bacterium]
MPLVSIITPAYNAEKYIAETIESVLQQTFSDWEMLITDDGSTDNTALIIKQYAEKDSRIIYLYQENGKQGKARNLAIKNAKGTYLAFIDADDLWVENKLEKQLAIYKQYPEVDLIYTSGISFSGSISNVIKVFHEKAGMIDSTEMYDTMLKGKSLPNLSVIVKKSWVDKVGGLGEQPEMQNAEDYQLWLKLLDRGCQMYGIDESLFYYRLHENQVTTDDSMAFTEAIHAVFFADLTKINRKEKRKILINRTNKYLLHYIDIISNEQIEKILNLYKNPLSDYRRYWLNRLLLLLGKGVFKRYYYR